MLLGLATNQRGAVRDQEAQSEINYFFPVVYLIILPGFGQVGPPLIPTTDTAGNGCPTPVPAPASATTAPAAVPKPAIKSDVNDDVTPSKAGSTNIPTPEEVAEHARTLTSPNGRWYLVTSGREVGVFGNWYANDPFSINIFRTNLCYYIPGMKYLP